MAKPMLWHYRSLETATQHILPRGGRLRLSPFITMRDPRESMRWDPAVTGTRQVHEADAWHQQLRSELDAVRLRAKTISLTRDDDPDVENVYERGFARPRLWEMYGSRPSGQLLDYRAVCLGFDHAELVDAVMTSLQGQGFAVADVRAGAIEYRDARVEVDVALADLNLSGVQPTVNALVHRELRHLFFTKLRDWETEREFRILAMARDPSSSPVLVEFEQSLRAVYAGNLTEGELDSLAQTVHDERPGVEVHALDWVNNHPSPRPIWLAR